MNRINELVQILNEANKAYRSGNPIMTDPEYDVLFDELYELDKNNEYFDKIGEEVVDEGRKRRLPIIMASMNKNKTIDEVHKWAKNKGIVNEKFILTPKLDGCSLVCDEQTKTATTRGDGVYGQDCTEHYILFNNKYEGDVFDYTYGELVMSKNVFAKNYSTEFANDRNLIAGILNKKEPTDICKDADYIKYGGYVKKEHKHLFKHKHDILNALNDGQKIRINYHICKLSDITDEFVIELFKKWGVGYTLDGLIVEVDDLKLQESLGRETSTQNPAYARAIKLSAFEEVVETEVIDMEWNISKNGILYPVAILNPVAVGGVVVSRLSLHNASIAKQYGVGIGSVIRLKRAGNVIPDLVGSVHSSGFVEPVIDGIEIIWDGLNLITANKTEQQKIQEIVSFFEILEADGISDGVVEQMWIHGFRNLKSILMATEKDFLKINGFAKTKATNVYKSVQKCITNVDLCKIQHASNLFSGLGSKKLVLLEHFTAKPTIEQVVVIKGFDKKSAEIYIDGWDKFQKFLLDLPMIKVKKTEAIQTISNDYENYNVCFSGVRDSDVESILLSRSAKIVSGVSSKTTHLIMKQIGTNSSKEIRALELGIKIMTLDELKKELVVY